MCVCVCVCICYLIINHFAIKKHVLISLSIRPTQAAPFCRWNISSSREYWKVADPISDNQNKKVFFELEKKLG